MAVFSADSRAECSYVYDLVVVAAVRWQMRGQQKQREQHEHASSDNANGAWRNARAFGSGIRVDAPALSLDTSPRPVDVRWVGGGRVFLYLIIILG